MLDEFFGSKAKLRIVRVAALEFESDFSIEDLARAVGMSYGTIHPAVLELENARVLVARKAGRSKLFKINRAHPMFTIVRELFLKEKSVFMNIAIEFVNELDKSAVRDIVLFGSTAREESSAVGDIDLLIVTRGEKAPRNMDTLVDEFLKNYDTIISPICLTKNEITKMINRHEDFILRIIDEGKELYGDAKWLKR